jgi:hypothetical protein
MPEAIKAFDAAAARYRRAHTRTSWKSSERQADAVRRAAMRLTQAIERLDIDTLPALVVGGRHIVLDAYTEREHWLEMIEPLQTVRISRPRLPYDVPRRVLASDVAWIMSGLGKPIRANVPRESKGRSTRGSLFARILHLILSAFQARVPDMTRDVRAIAALYRK